MIKVEKDFLTIPSILKSANRKEAFSKNIEAKEYKFGKALYKTKSVQDLLNKIYNLKCAFCEKNLLDSDKHIEHYRPKSTYYWLSYSWDNLLLACGSCNSSKGNRFKINGNIAVYKNEEFENIHELGSDYDIREMPLIVNPEKEDVINEIKYDSNARVFSQNIRVQHTIEQACQLNRDELVEKRLPILNDFKNQINKHYVLFKDKGDISRFIPDIENFLDKVSIKNEFYSFRYFIVNNIDIFFDNKNIQEILQALIKKIQNEKSSLRGIHMTFKRTGQESIKTSHV